MRAGAAADWTSGTVAVVSRPTAHAELAELYARHRTWLLAHCARRLPNRSDAEDALQQTFVYVFRSLERGVVPQYERAWLATIADNVCRNMSRRGAAAHESPGDVEHAAVADERSSTDARDLAAALAKLPPTQRHALVLREWRGLAYREIAAELDLTEPAVETLLFRARRRAAEVLAHRRRVLDAGTALSALRSLLGPTAAKLGAAAAVGCVGAAVAVPLAVTRDHPATPRPQRTAPEASRPAAPGASTVRPAPAAVQQEQAATPRRSEARGRPRAATHPPRPRLERPAAAPGSAPASGDAPVDRAAPRQPPTALEPSRGTQPEPASSKRPASPAATTTPATPVVDAVAGTASDAVGTVTTAGGDAVGTVTTAATGAVDTVTTAATGAVNTVTESAGGAAGGATGAASGATGAATGAVSGATGAVGAGPSLPAP